MVIRPNECFFHIILGNFVIDRYYLIAEPIGLEFKGSSLANVFEIANETINISIDKKINIRAEDYCLISVNR